MSDFLAGVSLTLVVMFITAGCTSILEQPPMIKVIEKHYIITGDDCALKMLENQPEDVTNRFNVGLS